MQTASNLLDKKCCCGKAAEQLKIEHENDKIPNLRDYCRQSVKALFVVYTPDRNTNNDVGSRASEAEVYTICKTNTPSHTIPAGETRKSSLVISLILIIRRGYTAVHVSKWNKVSLIKLSLNIKNNRRMKERKRAMNNVES